MEVGIVCLAYGPRFKILGGLDIFIYIYLFIFIYVYLYLDLFIFIYVYVYLDLFIILFIYIYSYLVSYFIGSVCEREREREREEREEAYLIGTYIPTIPPRTLTASERSLYFQVLDGAGIPRPTRPAAPGKLHDCAASHGCEL